MAQAYIYLSPREAGEALPSEHEEAAEDAEATAPRAAQSPPKPPPSLSNSVVMSTEALVIIPNTPVHYRSRFANRSGQKGPYDPTEGRRRPPKSPTGPPKCPSI